MLMSKLSKATQLDEQEQCTSDHWETFPRMMDDH
jgi:hypothetical protein